MALFKKKPKAAQAEASPDAEADATAAAAAPEGEEGGVAPAKKKGLPLKLMVIAAAGLIVVSGGGAGAFFMFGPHAKPGAQTTAKPKKKKKKEGEAGKDAKGGPVIQDSPDGGVIYTLPDMVVNMQTADGKPAYLALTVALELPDADTADVIEPNQPRLQDMFQTFLRELRPEDLAGSQGAYQVKTEILRRVNLVIAPARVKSVLIQKMLIN